MAASLTIFGWVISLGPGLALALAFEGSTMATLVIGLRLRTTALGIILPIVRDAGLVKSPFGARVLTIGAAVTRVDRPGGPERSNLDGVTG